MMKIKNVFILLLLLSLPVKHAQSQDQIPPEIRAQIQAQIQEQLKAQDREEAQPQPPAPLKNLSTTDKMTALIRARAPDVLPNQIPSLFFTSNEAALVAAVRNGIVARAPTGEELESGKSREATPEPGIRELTLGGIVFQSSEDWTIWLNEEKVTPKRIPKEILDISVYEDHIKIKWYDLYTNQIFPVKLRPHQRFNIDTRIFLPG